MFAIIICLLQAKVCMGQNQKVFEMAYPKSKTISVNEKYSKSIIIYPFKQKESLYSLSVSAKVQLNGYKSLVRVVLINENGEEYLVLESYYMIEEQKQINFTDYGDETAMLNGVGASSIKIEIEDASILLETVSYNNSSQNKLESTDFTLYSKIKKRNQDSTKIDRIKKQIKKNGYSWKADETSFSLMTYQQKKHFFGDTLPNLRGFEYYKGGIFDLTEPTSTTSTFSPMVASSVIESFDWRNRHGQNWMTSVKNQNPCGSCGIFAATGATEALVNLYYNQHLDMDLAEQNAVSCASGYGCSIGWLPNIILDYYTNTGVVDEAHFPYKANDAIPCSDMLPNPTERIKIGGRVDFPNSTYPLTEESLKLMIIKYGPLSGGISSWGHAMPLLGFYIDNTDSKTVWIFKNSGGPGWGDNGYAYVKVDINDIGWTHALLTPIQSIRYTDSDIKCIDLDGDGYYNWGVGPKPASCPACVPDEEDGDDSNPNLGPMNEYGFCRQLTAPITYPVSNITTNTIWNTKQVLCGDLVISNGATLTITNQLTMPVFSTITLQGNSKLVVDGGKITYANIVANSGSELTLQNNAVLQLYKNDELNVNAGAIFNNNFADIQMLSNY